MLCSAITPLRGEYKCRDRSPFTTEFRKKFAVTLRKQDYAKPDVCNGFKVLRNQTPSAFPDNINVVTTVLTPIL